MLKVQENSPLDRYDWVPAQLASALQQTQSKRVADIGAGDGCMRAAIEAAGGEWFGFDLEPQLPEITAWDLDKSCPEPQSFGVVILMDVVEHLNNPWLAMQHVSEILEPGGFLILTTPNPLWSRSRILSVLSGEPICFTPTDLELNHHVFTPWPHIIDRLLQDSKLELIRYDTLGPRTQWPGSPYNLRYLQRFLLAMGMRWLESRDARSCGMGYGMMARKKA